MDVDQLANLAVRREIALQMKLRGLTRKALAEKLGLPSPKVLHNMLNGQQKLRPEVVDRIREELAMPPTWPWSAENRMAVYERIGPTDLVAHAFPIAKPGTGYTPTITPALPGYENWQAVHLPDDAFEPVWHKGDLLLFAPADQIRLFPGRVVVVERPDGDQPLVRILGHDGKRYVLKGLNEAHPPLAAEGETMGIVVGRVHQDGTTLRIFVDPQGLRP